MSDEWRRFDGYDEVEELKNVGAVLTWLTRYTGSFVKYRVFRLKKIASWYIEVHAQIDFTDGDGRVKQMRARGSGPVTHNKFEAQDPEYIGEAVLLAKQYVDRRIEEFMSEEDRSREISR